VCVACDSGPYPVSDRELGPFDINALRSRCKRHNQLKYDMCRTCYEHFGSPTIDTPTVRRLARLLPSLPTRVRDGEKAWNIEDISLDNDLMWARQGEMEYAWLADMRRLSLAERASVLGLADSYWTPTD
jgi:hypothetical protein